MLAFGKTSWQNLMLFIACTKILKKAMLLKKFKHNLSFLEIARNPVSFTVVRQSRPVRIGGIGWRRRFDRG
jgi:hypothetical protein